jgi:hypothetical protein
MTGRKITALTERDKLIREAIKRAGLEPAPEQVNVDLSIAIVPRVSEEFGADVSRIAAALLLAMIDQLKDLSIRSPLTYLVLFPTLLNEDEQDAFSEHLRRSNRNTRVSVARRVDASAWNDSTLSGRVDLLAGNIAESIQMIRSDTLSPLDRKQLLEAVERSRQIVHREVK